MRLKDLGRVHEVKAFVRNGSISDAAIGRVVDTLRRIPAISRRGAAAAYIDRRFTAGGAVRHPRARRFAPRNTSYLRVNSS